MTVVKPYIYLFLYLCIPFNFALNTFIILTKSFVSSSSGNSSFWFIIVIFLFDDSFIIDSINSKLKQANISLYIITTLSISFIQKHTYNFIYTRSIKIQSTRYVLNNFIRQILFLH